LHTLNPDRDETGEDLTIAKFSSRIADEQDRTASHRLDPVDIRPITAADLEAVETLYLQVFANTFRPAFGRRPLETQVQIHLALRQARDRPTEGILAAWEDDQLVGVNLWKTAETGAVLLADSLRALAPLGPLGILRFLLVHLTVYIRYKPAAEEAYLCGPAIAPTHRGRGIGLALMQQTEHAVREAGKTYISALVASNNLAFRGLVQKLGYREVWIRKTPVRNWVFGESEIVRIEKPLKVN